MKILLTTFFLFFVTNETLSQVDTSTFSTHNTGRFRMLSIKFHGGKHFYTGNGLSDKLRHGYGAVEIRTGWQTKGKHPWEAEVNYPSYGLGWYTGYVGDMDIFGNPNALFGFVAFPLIRGKRLNLQVEPALGLTFNLKPYNHKTNEINDAIGSRIAVYFALHAGVRYRLTRELDLLFGYDMTHFSNGRTLTPNYGLNMGGFSGGFAYHYNGHQRKVDNSLHPSTLLEARPFYPSPHKPRKIREDNISLYQAFGRVQNKDDAGTTHSYTTLSTVLEYQHRFNTMHGITVGVDALFDPSAKDTAEYPLNKEQKSFFPAAHLGYDFHFWRLMVRLQIGVPLTSMGRKLKGKTFIRPAVRFEATKRFFAQIGLKTMNGATADWVEFGLGYKIFRKEHAITNH